ncbi:MAG: hypothetical protein ACRDYC_06450, partial [Acidimicrobiales bacterium]
AIVSRSSGPNRTPGIDHPPLVVHRAVTLTAPLQPPVDPAEPSGATEAADLRDALLSAAFAAFDHLSEKAAHDDLQRSIAAMNGALSYNQNLWMQLLIVGATYLPR